MSHNELGDIIICKDVIGMVVEKIGIGYHVKRKDGSIVLISKKAEIKTIATSYQIAALVYNKTLQKIKGEGLSVS